MMTRAAERTFFNHYYKQMLVDGLIPSMGFLLSRAAQKSPHTTALICGSESISYQNLYHRAAQFSRVLQGKGVKQHDRVLLLFENSVEFYIAYFGIVQLGAVVAPLNTFLHENELAYIIKDAQPTCMVVSSAFVPRVTAITDVAIPMLVTEDDLNLKNSAAMPEGFAVQAMAPDAMIALLYTSGTTGFPKGVMLSSKNIMTNVIQGFARLQLDSDDRFFGVLPLFHSFAQNACIWAAFYRTATVIVVPKITRHNILEGLQHKPTVFLGVPALYGFLCLLKTAPLDSVRLFVSGGDALPDKIRAAFALLYRRNILSGYGLTETCPMVSVALEDTTESLNSVGRLLPGISCSIRGDKGEPVAQGEVGELWLRGDNVMLGYYQAPEMTAQVIKDGWLNTGDLVYLDDQERLVISGRSKDLIINKGINIYPPEIENVIMGHPSVIRVGVIGKKDEAAGEVPVAYVQLREEVADIEKLLRALCTQHLAAYKVPRDFFCTTRELPTTATGKVNKKQLRAELEKSEKK